VRIVVGPDATSNEFATTVSPSDAGIELVVVSLGVDEFDASVGALLECPST